MLQAEQLVRQVTAARTILEVLDGDIASIVSLRQRLSGLYRQMSTLSGCFDRRGS
jgi:hypothetical protein